MEYTNIRGERIDLASLATPKVQKVRMPVQATHKGYMPVGFSPERVEDARKRHESESRLAVENGREPLPPFNVEMFLRNNKPKRVCKPFASYDAAVQAKVLAEKAGWLGVTIEELKKGGAA